MNYAKFVWLYLTQKKNFHETRVIRCSLGPLPGPEKVPLFGADCTKSALLADVVGEWREICSVREQFPLFVYKRLTKTTVSLKVNRHFVSYDNSRLNYSLRLSHE